MGHRSMNFARGTGGRCHAGMFTVTTRMRGQRSRKSDFPLRQSFLVAFMKYCRGGFCRRACLCCRRLASARTSRSGALRADIIPSLPPSPGGSSCVVSLLPALSDPLFFARCPVAPVSGSVPRVRVLPPDPFPFPALFFVGRVVVIELGCSCFRRCGRFGAESRKPSVRPWRFGTR